MAQGQGQGALAEPFSRISVDEAKRLLDAGEARAIDVREMDEWQSGHIATATHAPLARVLNAPHQVVTADNVIFVCAVGARSAVASEMAAALGYEHIYNMEGGMDAWKAKGYPIA